jgi:hypothetical protein
MAERWQVAGGRWQVPRASWRYLPSVPSSSALQVNHKTMPPTSRAVCMGTYGVQPLVAVSHLCYQLSFVPPVNLSCALSSTTSVSESGVSLQVPEAL